MELYIFNFFKEIYHFIFVGEESTFSRYFSQLSEIQHIHILIGYVENKEMDIFQLNETGYSINGHFIVIMYSFTENANVSY